MRLSIQSLCNLALEITQILSESKGDVISSLKDETIPPASSTINIPAATSQGLSEKQMYASCSPFATWQKPITAQANDLI